MVAVRGTVVGGFDHGISESKLFKPEGGREEIMAANPSADRVADHFVNYLFGGYQGSMHVRRVASWVGLLALAIDNLPKSRWWFSKTRQLMFEYKSRRFKVKYNHTIKPRGGIEIVEIEAKPGSPEIKTVVSIGSLKDAEAFYNKPVV